MHIVVGMTHTGLRRFAEQIIKQCDAGEKVEAGAYHIPSTDGGEELDFTVTNDGLTEGEAVDTTYWENG